MKCDEMNDRMETTSEMKKFKAKSAPEKSILEKRREIRVERSDERVTFQVY